NLYTQTKGGDMNNDLIIIGIGEGGGKIVSKLDEKYQKLFIDTDEDVIEKYNGLRIGKKTCGEYSSQGDINLAELSVIESKEDLLSAIKNYDEIIIVAPLGGGTSCGTTKKFVELIIDPNKPVKLFTSFPFDFEGRSRLLKAIKTFDYLKQLCDVILVDKFDIYKIRNRISINQIFENQDNLYIQAIEKSLL
uniref:hypothetical protein n=1 Tax=Candidatus Stercorousia sp. TaxID=3048886 RepID=UPI0040293BCB